MTALRSAHACDTGFGNAAPNALCGKPVREHGVSDEAARLQRAMAGPVGLRNPRSLCFALPLSPGDRLVVVGAFPEVVRSAEAMGVDTVSVLTSKQREAARRGGRVAIVDAGDPVPLADRWADHLIIPALRGWQRYLLARELARIVRPGGHVFLTAKARWRAPRDTSALTLRQGRRLLRDGGFEVVEEYAVRPGLHNPHHLVPVASREALRWYVERAYLPVTSGGLLHARVLRTVPSRRLALTLFPALGIRARRIDEVTR